MRSRASLLDFTRYLFLCRKNAPWEFSPHHGLIAGALMRVYAGEISRLIINIPPRYSKTEFVINFMAWALGQYPDCEFIYTSYSARLAAMSSWNCREIVRTPEYQKIFPGTILRTDSSAKDEWRTTAGGMVYAVGSGGTITGYGAGKKRSGFGGCIIIDDPHKADEASSQVMRANVWDWFGNTLESRVNAPGTPIIVIMQRLHEDDLSGHLLAGHNGERWEHLCLPAITSNGKALWPFMHTLDRLAAMREANPYAFSGQYMQQPSPPSGGMFETDRLEIIDALPEGIDLIRAWDPAYTNGATSCFTSGAKLGMFEETVYIADISYRKTANPDDMVAATAQLDGEDIPIVYPKDPGAGEKVFNDLVRRMNGYIIRGHRPTREKTEAWLPFASQVNGRNVKLLRGEWNHDFITDLQLAPNGHRKDLIDSVCYGYNDLNEGGDIEWTL